MSIEKVLDLPEGEEQFAPKLEKDRFLRIIANFTRAYVMQRMRLEREAAFLRTLQTRRGLDTTRRAVIDIDGPEYEATLEDVLKPK